MYMGNTSVFTAKISNALIYCPKEKFKNCPQCSGEGWGFILAGEI
jgi:hypothetical protein